VRFAICTTKLRLLPILAHRFHQQQSFGAAYTIHQPKNELNLPFTDGESNNAYKGCWLYQSVGCTSWFDDDVVVTAPTRSYNPNHTTAKGSSGGPRRIVLV
jgi:hypothetical protein